MLYVFKLSFNYTMHVNVYFFSLSIDFDTADTW